MIDRKDFIASIGAPDDGFNAAMDQALLRIHEERSDIMKRKMSFTLVAAIIALLAVAGAALAMGANLFEFFGRDDTRLSALAPQSELETSIPGTVESDVLGQTRATLNNGYYDGESLIIAFTLENSECYAPFTPDADQLAQMDKADGEASYVDFNENMPGAEAVEAFRRAVEDGTPCGYAKYCVYPSDHCSVGDGIDLPPWYERSEVQEDHSILYLREFERPLPKAAQQQESLDVSIHLKQMSVYYYFDGRDIYLLYQHGSDVTDVTASIPRTDAISRRFSAASSYNEIPIEISMDVSAVQATMNISSAQCAFPDLEAHQWYDAVLLDESGHQLRTLETSFRGDTASINFQGTGALPESLTLYIGNWHEGKWDKEDFIADAIEIPLSAD